MDSTTGPVWRRPTSKVEGDFFGIKHLKPSMRNLVLTVIVLEQDPNPTVTKDGHVVRNLLVADRSGKIRLSVWNEPGEYLVPGDIIRVTRWWVLQVNSFFPCISLSFKSNQSIDSDHSSFFCIFLYEKQNPLFYVPPQVMLQVTKECSCYILAVEVISFESVNFAWRFQKNPIWVDARLTSLTQDEKIISINYALIN